MMKRHSTIGSTVMVSPVLWSSDYMGRIGTIETRDFRADKIGVSFENGEMDWFSSKNLFVLRPVGELIELAENKKAGLWPPIPENLQTIARLQASGSDEKLKHAFEMVQDDPELHRWATIRLNEVINIASQERNSKSKFQTLNTMENESSNGTVVLVLPDLKNDPATKRGQIGVVTYARSAYENYVRFPEGNEAIYPAEQVLKLKDKQQILDDLTKNGSSMPLDDFKAMYKIMLLQERGTSQASFSALAIAKDNPGVRHSVLESIDPAQIQDLAQSHGR
ncbi:hypothetical protein [Mucilaginibacter sp. SJ]|uniref:hypothetical protein n=1 Tax=Mucilaginibacter sp. SJ TaxID=3029053 RepID=UPI0023AA06C7|nr:hypothetical protein [Mucilaginibacter sp. SJ]WEA00764.1 hypothetical protein MusilaSJ_25245 [Mucilaginibacter sp. SJ]